MKNKWKQYIDMELHIHYAIQNIRISELRLYIIDLHINENSFKEYT